MLRIRKEQIAAFYQSSLCAFETRTLIYLAAQYPEEYQRQGENAMRKLIRDTAERAKGYKVDSEAGVVVCIELSLVYGEDFYQRESWATYILSHSELDTEMKVERLKGYLGEELS
jgi:hypothetical protein